jgi:hypothetical protein
MPSASKDPKGVVGSSTPLRAAGQASPSQKVTRFAAELVDDAAVHGSRQSRSATQQLDYWARLGRAVSDSTSPARSRIEDALAGALAASELSREEGLVFNAEVSVAIEVGLSTTHYGRELAAQGITTVALDDDGELVEYSPDGSTRPLPLSGTAR